MKLFAIADTVGELAEIVNRPVGSIYSAISRNLGGKRMKFIKVELDDLGHDRHLDKEKVEKDIKIKNNKEKPTLRGG